MNFLKSLFSTTPANYNNLVPEDFLEQLKTTKNAVLLDVRTKAEFNNQKINGALNIDFYDASFGTALDKLDKEKAYFVYCRSGNRSGQACNLMAKRGFTKLYNLSGGIASLI